MNTSIFQVAGPVMIGPSSSHTAGAAKIGRIARQIVNGDFDRVTFGLYGSFDKTGKGHGTDKALLAGVMGIREDDERISKSFELAEQDNLEFEFYSVDLPGAHENSVIITFYKNGEIRSRIQGASVGGGNVRIVKIDGYEIGISGELPTIFVKQNDQKGVISHVATILADNGINIATMKVSRMQKKQDAICVIEIDDSIDEEILNQLKAHPYIQIVRFIACA
ncbi:L-serine ammonia-lyase, iron-sulfur-dependent subunit beta [Aminipila luticellarii]|uniref:L-serine deaminase n=1 Tax=Aminipila luticellarii TaxID=2507160 RepID=A0A410PY61_9FIRM|nr:L-serine ammonia-lyase, iron-sulfur-dependent subunit beta [Aminipila luticellarii]QAT43878.1 L-serine ammonia-lyase, iron-sulfur-dependent, subunit beta [Aminipila luticellarii]